MVRLIDCQKSCKLGPAQLTEELPWEESWDAVITEKL
jgi:hypothetical protein